MSNKGHYHDKGEQDGSKGEYRPPHGLLDDFTTWSDSGMQKNIEENRAYDEGWLHARGQHDANEGRYKNTHNSEHYDSGWESANDQSSSSGSGCFIASACLEAGLLFRGADSLETVRAFRDELVRDPKGRQLVAEYTRLAPIVLEQIRLRSDGQHQLAILAASVEQAAELIRTGRQNLALAYYRAVLSRLLSAGPAQVP